MSTDKAFYNSLGASTSTHDTGIEMEDTKANEHTIIGDTWGSGVATKMNVIDGITGNRGVFDAVDNSNNYRFAINASWAVNWFLLGEL